MNPLASATTSELQEARERGSFDYLELIVNRISESVAGILDFPQRGAGRRTRATHLQRLRSVHLS